ncbi:MAG: TRAP transporter small permease [Eubacterium sp.]|nr:TRAP transporter small permease [Eubacterium sp.]
MKIHARAEKVDKIIFKIMYAVSVLAGISLMVVAVLCTVDALASKFLSFSIPSGTDWVTFLNIPIVFLAMGYIQVERGNTAVDILSSKYPPKIGKMIRVGSCIVATLICVFLGYCGFEVMMDKIVKHTLSSAQMSAFPVWPFALMVAVGYSLAAVSFFWCIIREFLIPPERRMGAMPPAPEKEGE